MVWNESAVEFADMIKGTFKLAKESLKHTASDMKKYYDQKTQPEKEYQKGDQVLLEGTNIWSDCDEVVTSFFLSFVFLRCHLIHHLYLRFPLCSPPVLFTIWFSDQFSFVFLSFLMTNTHLLRWLLIVSFPNYSSFHDLPIHSMTWSVLRLW